MGPRFAPTAKNAEYARRDGIADTLLGPGRKTSSNKKDTRDGHPSKEQTFTQTIANDRLPPSAWPD